MAKKRFKRILAGALVVALIAGLVWVGQGTAPTPKGPDFYIRYDHAVGLPLVLRDLKRRGVVQDPTAYRIYGFLVRASTQIGTGTYQMHPGMSADEVFAELRKPMRQLVRIPETNWALRTANLLDTKYNVCAAREYMALVNNPNQFQGEVSFPLPPKSLEGYLYPDTYDLPPLIGARAVVLRQLHAFDDKVWKPMHPANLDRTLTLASMVELESGYDGDRPMIAGVIENRLTKKMRLQIDAALLYGIQKWRRLTFADYKNLKTPYNTYLYAGLPPGPICSPSVKSIEAAMHPTKHPYVYYVALPNGRSLFSATYEEHKRNIAKRKKALEESGD
jgi:UPF0755 protein